MAAGDVRGAFLPPGDPTFDGALGDAAAWPVQSFLDHYFHEFEYMVKNDGRSVVNDIKEVAA